MANYVRLIAGARSAALAVSLTLLLASAAQAQTLLAATVALDHGGKAAATLAMSATPVPLTAQLTIQLDEARAQLTQARHLRDESADRYQSKFQEPVATNRLLDWLVDLQGEKVKRLEDMLALQNTPKSVAEDDPLVKALDGQPPHSALHIDALRDELDGLKENLAAVEARARANQTEMQNLGDQLKGKAAAARMAGDHAFPASRGSDVAAAQEEGEGAKLMVKVAEAELAVATLEQESLKRRIASLSARVRDLQAVVARVLPDQRLTPDDLEAQRRRVGAERDKLAAEVAEVSKRYLRHSTQRDRLRGDGRTADDESNRRDALLDLAVKTDNAILKGLDDLQVLTGVAGDSWEQRYLVLSSVDSRQRSAARTALRQLREKLVDWRGLSHMRQEALRTEIREQRMRIGDLASDVQVPQLESQRLDLLLQQAAMDERVELAATRLERQVSRWLADFDDAQKDGFGRVAWLGGRVTDLFARIWQQELFVAEDVSEVDGHRVTVQYGVTIGKSIGVVTLIVLGYWLFSRLARGLQHLLMRRFKVGSQPASVVRRWTMIILCLALVVFVLNLARIPLSVFAFLGGALAIGVGFGAQTIIKNFISGLIVLFERHVRIGDIVELGGIVGHVTAVDLRATTVRGFNGVEAMIPNANFIENQVVNWTYSNRQIRHELKVGIAYGTDLRRAESLFLAAATSHAHVLGDPAPEVFFEDFGDSALTVVLVYWVELDSPLAPRRVGSDLRHDIYQRLMTAGIAIPFPQHEIHVNFTEHPGDAFALLTRGLAGTPANGAEQRPGTAS